MTAQLQGANIWPRLKVGDRFTNSYNNITTILRIFIDNGQSKVIKCESDTGTTYYITKDEFIRRYDSGSYNMHENNSSEILNRKLHDTLTNVWGDHIWNNLLIGDWFRNKDHDDLFTIVNIEDNLHQIDCEITPKNKTIPRSARFIYKSEFIDKFNHGDYIIPSHNRTAILNRKLEQTRGSLTNIKEQNTSLNKENRSKIGRVENLKDLWNNLIVGDMFYDKTIDDWRTVTYKYRIYATIFNSHLKHETATITDNLFKQRVRNNIYHSFTHNLTNKNNKDEVQRQNSEKQRGQIITGAGISSRRQSITTGSRFEGNIAKARTRKPQIRHLEIQGRVILA